INFGICQSSLHILSKVARHVILEKFSSTFFKRWRSGGRAALLALRRGRNSLAAFLFCELFSLRLLRAKKKVDERSARRNASVQTV
ncbi:MAG: hypothetical protein IJW98_04325, partial [Clostridia bacterium]|nr:hypothetical protein [Clostridia bacterium]